jgi:2-amino-4-hydroxy-6-hydroxymethyldihydropteridine diphosphokinase
MVISSRSRSASVLIDKQSSSTMFPAPEFPAPEFSASEFPASEFPASEFPFVAAIALGSNLGDSRQILATALTCLDDTPGIKLMARSQWYLTAPVGPPQPDYLNGCALLNTNLTPPELMQTLLQIETRLGRVRRERWGARTVDLDLLLFDDVILTAPELTIPHPRMRDRAFVMIPLMEIAPNWQDPVTGQSIAVLAQALDRRDVQLSADSLKS